MTEIFGRSNPEPQNNTMPCSPPNLYRNTPLAAAFGRRGHSTKCLRIVVAVSFARQRQPQSMLGPVGRPPRLDFADRFRVVSRTVGRRGQSVKCRRISPLVSLAPQPHPHGIRGPGDRPTRLMAFGYTSEILTRTQLLHFPQLPDRHRLQNGRARCLNCWSWPQHRQTRSGRPDSLFRSRSLHSWHVPDKHRLQYGRTRHSDWRSAPQQMQTRKVADGPIPSFYVCPRLHFLPVEGSRLPMKHDARPAIGSQTRAAFRRAHSAAGPSHERAAEVRRNRASRNRAPRPAVAVGVRRGPRAGASRRRARA